MVLHCRPYHFPVYGGAMPEVLWWGHFDPDYSRNRILRQLLGELGWVVHDFRPAFSAAGDLEASLRRVPRPDLVWVPCFRQRDLAAASRWARRQGVPLVFDPLISAYDKQVHEREKFTEGSVQANRLLAREQSLFQSADRVIADTPAHADYFAETLGVARQHLAVVYVGAEESLFRPEPVTEDHINCPLEVLFFGSFIPLQGPQVIVEAARIYAGPPVKWTLLGKGPLRAQCEEDAVDLDNVCFEDWVPYEELPARIGRANILLGIFGSTPKAARVIPNKVFQSLACGRPVITRTSGAYPETVTNGRDSGLIWVRPGDAHALADRVANLASAPEQLHQLGNDAVATSQREFSSDVLRVQLGGLIKGVMR